MTLQEYIREFCKYPNTLTEAEFKASGLPSMGGQWLRKCRNTQVNVSAMRRAVALDAKSRQMRFSAGGKSAPSSSVKTNVGALATAAKFQMPKKKKKKGLRFQDFGKPEPFTGDVNSPEFLTSFEWRRVRFLALQRYGQRCQCCGASPSDGAVLNVDHVKPRRKYPHLALDINNLQILCGDCNHGKANMTVDFR